MLRSTAPESDQGAILVSRVLVALLFSSGVLTRAATVQVLDADRRPVSGVLVTCLGREEGAALTGPEGTAALPDACRRVSCARGGYVSGEAVIEGARAVCRISTGVFVRLDVPEPGCGDDCSASLYWLEGALGGVSALLKRGDDSWTARLGPVAPGTYELGLVRVDDHWVCGTAMTLSEPGEHRARGIWREPFELHGIVRLEDGRAGFDVPVHVKSHPGEAARPEGVWQCRSLEGAPDVFTGPDGAFTLRVDPEESLQVEAGSSWGPDGHAILDVPAGTSGRIELRLKR